MWRQFDDLRISFRLLAKHPGFTLLAVFVLGLGIGSTTAVFSLVQGVVLRSLPFPEPDRLVALWEVEGAPDDRTPLSPPTLRDWQESQTALQGLAAYVDGRAVVMDGEEPRRVRTARVTPEFFSTLGAPILLGRGFAREDGGEAVVIPSHDFWIRSLGGDPAAVGGSIRLGEKRHRIVGVAPPDFALPAGTELWVPLDPEFGREVRGAHILTAVGRLAPGSTPERAESELSAISAGVEEYGGDWSARVVPLHEELVGEVRGPLLILLGAVLIVLLVAGTNVASLILARTFGRERELAVRASMGASRGRIVSLVLTESLLLSLAGGVVGVLMASWTLDLLVSLVPGDLPRAAGVTVDRAVLLFALTISVVTGILAGLAPALRASRRDPARVLKESSPGATADREAMGLRRGLVVAETGLTVLLLVGAGLLARSFLTLSRVDPGFRAANVLAFDLALPPYRYAEPVQWHAFFGRLGEELEALPAVTDVALTRNPPLKGRSMSSPVRIEGRDTEGDGGATYVQASTVNPGYFRTLGIEHLSGRGFAESDGSGAPPVAVVNRAFAETFFPGEDAVGERARTLFGQGGFREIVGVVDDVRHHALAEAAPPTFYTPLGQDPSPSFTVLVRTAGEPKAALSAVRGVVRRIDPGLPLAELATLDELLARSVAGPRFYMTTVGVFAALAVILALVGLYGLLATSVARRRKEMGIRFAMGAGRSRVLGLVLREALLLSGLGVGLGLAGAFGLSRILESLLFGVSPTDPLALLGGAGAVFVAAVLSALVPAWRAARVRPADVLRG